MDESATAGLSSGELFFRSDPTAAQSFLPHGLIQWLAASAPGKSEPVRLKAQGDLVRSARQRAVACRAARIAELEADRGYGSSLIELNRLAVQVNTGLTLSSLFSYSQLNYFLCCRRS
jgi:hypothetical protein